MTGELSSPSAPRTSDRSGGLGASGENNGQASQEDVQQFLDAAAAADAGTLPVEVTRNRPRKRRPSRKKAVDPAAAKAELSRRASQVEDITDEQLLADAGITPFYSTTETAQFFDRTTQWIYWGLRPTPDGPIFVDLNGAPIKPERVGDPKTGRRRFTLPIIKEILLSSYRRGNIEPEELKKILRRIRINELGGEWREREGWHKIRGKWVHPRNCMQDENGKWIRIPGTEEDDE